MTNDERIKLMEQEIVKLEARLQNKENEADRKMLEYFQRFRSVLSKIKA